MIKIINKVIEDLYQQYSSEDWTERRVNRMSIVDVSPLDLGQFISDNSIPSDCYFDDDGSGMDCEYHEPHICWDTIVPMGDRKREMEIADKVNRNALTHVGRALRAAGYVRVSPSVSFLQEFRGVKVYTLYVEHNDVELWEYFSGYYKKA